MFVLLTGAGVDHHPGVMAVALVVEVALAVLVVAVALVVVGVRVVILEMAVLEQAVQVAMVVPPVMRLVAGAAVAE